MTTRRHFGLNAILLASVAWTAALVWTVSASSTTAPVRAQAQAPASVSPVKAAMETSDEAAAASAGCVTCHTKTDEASMHPSGTVTLGCATCHGGDPKITVPASSEMDSSEYRAAKRKAHPQARVSDMWKSAANPERAYTAWLQESPEYIQFVNPGDLRVIDKTCGKCHAVEVRNVRTSMMTTGAMLWQAALYNNGGAPYKNARYGESYGPDGQPQRLQAFPAPTAEETRTKGWLASLEPLPRWEISQPGNVLRAFERGGGKKAEIGNPTKGEEPGRPDVKLSDRGFGTSLRTDPVFLGLQKTRLLDPLLAFPGTNDQPGDYRGSGCTGCHVVYANDRDPDHAGLYAKFGNEGKTATVDPTIDPKRLESGHPIKHVFTRSIPSSQCMTCHMHPGTNMVTTYYGYTWWENETDGEKMYPEREIKRSEAEKLEIRLRNPEQTALKGKWGDRKFLGQVGTPEFNKNLEHTQFADFHGHGWVYRAVYKRDRRGNLLDADNKIVPHEDPNRFAKAVHLKDIHLEKGMQCNDCHFASDNHGNGKLYGETRNAVEIDCVDCHGSIEKHATLITSGPASPEGGTALAALRTPWRERRFAWEGDRLYQRSMMDPNLKWEVVQTVDTITPGRPHYSEQSRYAKTIRKDGTWGAATANDKLAHATSSMTCFTCHTSWTPTCFGCHLSMVANRKMPMLHNEGLTTRNWTAYNFQILRDDSYFLGKDGTVTKNRIAPVRSACAILVSSQNQSRSWIYYMQQTVSAEGYSGQAFSTYVPHTVRAKETKQCTDCHLSPQGNNNAWMANLLLQGTNFMNFMGHNVWVADGKGGFEGVTVAERDEPPAIIGSHLHRLAYPSDYEEHKKRNLQLPHAHHHPAGRGEEILDVQQRGEYVYAALGEGGFRIYDISNIDNKDFSERVVTAPVSPWGQRLYVKTKFATAVATPTTLGVDPLRKHHPENEEQPIHLMYGFLYVTDREEGLVIVGNKDPKSRNVIGVGTLLDGNPANNFLERAVTFNPDGVLDGARRITIAGTYAYLLTPKDLVVVSLEDPFHPKVVAKLGEADGLHDPRGVQIQFRYGFVVDKDGLKVLDVTSLDKPRVVKGALVPFKDARNLYVARTYAFVAGGHDGLGIVDVEQPERPVLEQMFNDGGKINDTNDVKIGMTNASQFAYLADGHNGLQIVQLFSPSDNPNYLGFSPKPTPQRIAQYPMHEALVVSEGIDRDRAVDESGNQLAVFGRRGARPLMKAEAEKLFMRDGQVYTVTNTPAQRPVEMTNPAGVVATLKRWLDGVVAKF
ncbi:MAG TPA: hypothetical protein VEL51_10055 [Vicinamibacterales bacterium]|nr:hypothetical protein [Vicinamibacterales bacterium]